MPALGEQFRVAREARGLSLSEVAEQIRIRSVYLGEIEAENWAAIGAPVYVRGFLRTYARFLGLDPEEAVGQFNKTDEGAPNTDGTGLSGAAWSNAPEKNLSPLIWVASAVAAVLVAFVIYNFIMLRQPRGAVASATATSAPLSQASPSPLPSNSAGGSPQPRVSAQLKPQTMEVLLTASSWLRVTIDGNVNMEGTFPKGTAKSFHGKAAVALVGNAGGVKIIVNGKPVGALGKIGDVAERTFTL